MSSTEVIKPHAEATPARDSDSSSNELHQQHAPSPEDNTGDHSADHDGHNDEGHDHEDHNHGGHNHSDHEGHTPALNPECTREVEINLPADVVSKQFRKVVKRYQKLARIPGFRAGKVPESLIRTRFADSIRQDVIEAVLPGEFKAEIEKQGLKPLSQPQVTDIQLADGEPLHFKAAFEVLPEFSVEGYEDIDIPRPDTTLTDAEYQAELARVVDSRSTMETVNEERGLESGDWAQISFKGEFVDAAAAPEVEDDAAAAEPITGEDVHIQIGGPDTLESFNTALTGARPGQELKFEVAYPPAFGERKLAGKTIAYDVEVRAIKRKAAPELNDDFARELGEYQTLDEFTTQLRQHLEEDKRRRLESMARDQMMEALIARFHFPVPEYLVQQQVDARLDRGLRALAAQGMRSEDMRKLDFDRLRHAQHDSASAEVKGLLILDRIADAQGIEVSEEEVEQNLQLISAQSREPLETLRARLTEDGSINRIREQLRREKTGAELYRKLSS
ncbi:MAG TPA: trigger factor [Acidisarcina sp.]